MRSILLIDKRSTFISDIQTHMMIENHTFTICSGISDVSNLMVTIQNFNPTEIYLSENMIDAQPDWNFSNILVKTYALSDEGEIYLLNSGYPYVGKICSTLELIDIIEKNIIINTDIKDNGTGGAGNMDINNQMNEQNNTTQQMNQIPQMPNMSMMGMGGMNSAGGVNGMGNQISPDMMMQMMQMMQMNQQSAQTMQMPQMPQTGQAQPSMPQTPQPVQQSVPATQPYSDLQPQVQQTQTVNPVQQINTMQMTQEQQLAQQSVMNDIHRGDKDTRVITFFSSKGGAGTTSIAESVAIQLSKQPGTRGNLKVCLVDFDIDFGDVLTDLQLDMSNEKKNITAWADNIRRQVETIVASDNSGRDINEIINDAASSIKFSNDEIIDFMQQYNNTSLYVLPAPITHKDSMKFEGYEFLTILDNLKDSKEFDYVIIDTKSDSRDATYCALDVADTVYMVFTQEISCINSNDSFYSALKDVNFDISKFMYVINRVRNQSETGLGTTEIESTIPYKCAGHMHEASEMTKAHNKAVPLVFTANNTFTKDIDMFISGITGTPVVESKKRGLFKR